MTKYIELLLVQLKANEKVKQTNEQNKTEKYIIFYIKYDILNYGLSPYFVFQDEIMHPFFQQEVKISAGCEFEDILILIMTSFTLFGKTQVTLSNYINKECCHVSIKM